MIKRLHMVNIRSHVDTEIEFEKGVNVLVGPNGAGKTTVLDAILLALFPPRGKRGRLKRENLIRKGERRAVVRLDFSSPDGSEYRVEREFRPDGQTAVLRMKEGNGWRVVAQGAENVTEAVADALGVDRSLFENAVYVKQGEIQAIVEAPPSERKELIDGVLGLRDFDKASERAREALKIVESRVDAMKNIIREKRVEIRRLEKEVSQAPKLREELERVEEELERLSSRKRELEDVVDRWKELIRAAESVEDRLEEARRDVKELETMLERAEEARKRLESIEPKTLEEELEHVKSELEEVESTLRRAESTMEVRSRVKARLEELKRRIDSIEERLEGVLGDIPRAPSHPERLSEILSELESLIRKVPGSLPDEDDLKSKKEELKAVEAELSELKRRERELRERLEELETEIGALLSEKRELERRLKALEEAGSKCPVCGRKLDSETRERLLRETRERLEELRRSLKSLQSEKAEVKGELERIEDRIERLEEERTSAVSELKALERDREALEAVAGELRDLMESLGVSVPDDPRELVRRAEGILEDLKSALELARKLRDLKREREEREEELRELEETADFPLDDDFLEELKARRSELLRRREEIEGKLREVERLKERASEVEDLRERLEARRRDLRSFEDELKRLRDELATLEEEHGGLDGLETELRELERRLESLREERGRLRRALEDVDAKREELERLKEELRRKEREYEALKTLGSYVDACRDVFKVAKEVRREVALPRVERVASKLLSEMSDALGGEVRLEDGGERILVRGPSGEWVEADVLSGGEKVLVGLALRLGLASAGSGFASFVMLDEPTVHLDEEHRGRLAEALGSLRVGVDQAIVVTHDPELEDAADVVFRVRKAGGNVSEVECVEATEAGSG